jgi:brefeldin A-inhibited guanine nucleotide-exchange protein
MNIISKIGTIPFTTAQARANEPASPVLTPSKDRHHTVPPSLSTYSLSVSGSMDTSTMGLSEHQLKRQGLECLVAVLRSLVAWGTSSAGKSVAESVADTALRPHGDDIRPETVTPDASVDRVSLSANSVEALRQPTPDVADDPSRFESAKQKKTTLLEGIKKFNYKPKRVGAYRIHLAMR